MRIGAPHPWEAHVRARALWMAGLSVNRIGRQIGINPTTVQEWRQKERWPARPLVGAKYTAPADCTWPPRMIEQLTALWNESDLSARQIGERLGVSGNAVIGKAHRLRLAARPDPTKRPAGIPRRRATGPTKAEKRAEERAAVERAVEIRRAAAQTRATRATAPQPAPDSGPAPKPPVAPPQAAREHGAKSAPPVVRVLRPSFAGISPARECQFIEGDGRPWTVCGKPALPGYSWCEEHRARVFMRVRREEAA